MEVIRVNELSKSFKVYHDKPSTLKDRLISKKRSRYEQRAVLKKINLSINRGEVVGLIGENGSGKSTLLKLLTRIIYPDHGSVDIKGKVSSLIELGAGFHPDMSGRENIYTNASIFGLTRKEIDKRLNKIIAFSELEEFIDNPVRTYSSGMYMRLAFSVAINVDAEILLIDEILAVGDANFQAKCFSKLRKLKANGMTIVIVTHDTGTIERFCTKVVWLNEGKIQLISTASKAVDAYLSYMNDRKFESVVAEAETEELNRVSADEIPQRVNESFERGIEETDDTPSEQKKSIDEHNNNRFGLKHVEIEKALLKNSKGEVAHVFKGDELLEIEIHYKVNTALKEYIFGIGVCTLDGFCLVGSNTQHDRITIPHKGNVGVVRCLINKIPFLSGEYILQVAVVDENGTPMDFVRDYCHFEIVSQDRSVGVISLQHEWSVS